MFIGHLAVGYALKRLAPKMSLGATMAAPLFLDLLWPVTLATGLESVRIDPGNTAVMPLDLRDYPYTHSLATAALWSLLFGGGCFLRSRDRGTSLLLGLGVFSHWILDWISHRPDLPLYPGSTVYLGLGLWNSVPGTLVVEFALYAAGIWMYVGATRARDRAGSAVFWAVAALFVVVYLAGVFGPPPPGPGAVAAAGFLSWLFIPLFAWIDRKRETVNL